MRDQSRGDSRGFDQYERYVVGITNIERSYRGYIIILVQERGVTYGYLGRYMWSRRKLDSYNVKAKERGLSIIPPYRNHSVNFDVLLFGFDEIEGETSTVIIVESIYDEWGRGKLVCLYGNVEDK
jgi:hypothetical protein